MAGDLINPHTGRTFGDEEIQLQFAQIYQALEWLRQRNHGLSMQQIHTGLMLEWVMNKLKEHNIELDTDQFPQWADARYKEIQAEAQQAMEAQIRRQQEAAKSPSEVAVELGVDLDE